MDKQTTINNFTEKACFNMNLKAEFINAVSDRAAQDNLMFDLCNKWLTEADPEVKEQLQDDMLKLLKT